MLLSLWCLKNVKPCNYGATYEYGAEWTSLAIASKAQCFWDSGKGSSLTHIITSILFVFWSCSNYFFMVFGCFYSGVYGVSSQELCNIVFSCCLKFFFGASTCCCFACRGEADERDTMNMLKTAKGEGGSGVTICIHIIYTYKYMLYIHSHAMSHPHTHVHTYTYGCKYLSF